jgi:tetratricopeptide (TPR) repeat protein
VNSLGATLRSLQRYDEALAHFQVAVATNRQTGQRLLEGHGLAVMGDVYRDQGAYAQALAIAEECIDEELRQACVQVRVNLPAEE